jgi:enoyl-CoA hydratase
MTFQTILLEQPEAGIYLLTVNRPQVLNALAPQVINELHEAFKQVSADKAARCLLITGAGEKAFVAGADISQMQSMAALDLRDFALKALDAFRFCLGRRLRVGDRLRLDHRQ